MKSVKTIDEIEHLKTAFAQTDKTLLNIRKFINENENLSEFIACDKIIACGGSWVCKKTYEETVKVCLEARKIIKGE